MKKLLFLLLLIPFLGTSQGTFTAPVGYNTGAPTAAPSGVGTRWRFDLLTGKKYTWNPDAVAWDEDPRGIDQISGCSAPMYTPGYNQSTFAVNSCSTPELYQYYSSAWHCLNCGGGTNISAGSGITLSGTAPDITISADDNSPTNEIQTLSIAGSNLSLSNGGGTVALPATGITSLGGQTGGTQTFATGTSGTDFSISSTTNTHTFNLPSASAANRGALTSADWSVFNSKIAGSGTSGYLSKWSGGSVLSASGVYDNSGAIGIGTATTSGRLRVVDNGASGNYVIEVHTDDQIPWVAAFFNDTYSSSIPGLEYFIFNNGSFAMGTGAAGKAFSIYQGYGNNRLTIQADGNFYFQKNIGALTSNPSSAVDITGATGYTQLRLRTSYTPTGSADALGSTGDTAWDANYFYIKTAAGWKRAALSTF